MQGNLAGLSSISGGKINQPGYVSPEGEYLGWGVGYPGDNLSLVGLLLPPPPGASCLGGGKFN